MGHNHMNPFVNPNKRSISLPKGCKDLADVLPRAECKHDDPIRRFLLLVLAQAQLDGATELVIGALAPCGDASIRYQIAGTWHDLPPFPSHIRPSLIAQLAR